MRRKRSGALIIALETTLPSITNEWDPYNEISENDYLQKQKEEYKHMSNDLLKTSISSLRKAGIREILCIFSEKSSFLNHIALQLHVQAIVCKNRNQNEIFDAMRVGLDTVKEVWNTTVILPTNHAHIKMHSLYQLINSKERRLNTEATFLLYKEKRGWPCIIQNSIYNIFLTMGDNDSPRNMVERLSSAFIKLPDPAIINPISTDKEYDEYDRKRKKGERPDPLACEEIWNYCSTDKRIWSHLRIVGDISLYIATLINRNGQSDIDPGLAQAGALLHGVAKGQLNEPKVGAHWVKKLGYPAVSHIIETIKELPEECIERLDECAIVFWADKIVKHNRPCYLKERYSRSLEKNSDNLVLMAKLIRIRDVAIKIQSNIMQRLNCSEEELIKLISRWNRPLPKGVKSMKRQKDDVSDHSDFKYKQNMNRWKDELRADPLEPLE